MVRNLANLARPTYDVVVIGGGIYGVCIAWEAATRGLSVALIERGDFGYATSANSLRVIHGGLRYLQHGDILRVRRSIRERAAFMRTAPHLVHPLPILIPTYGHSLRGKEIFSIALLLNKLIGLDQNGGSSPRLPDGYLVSREECLRLVPGIYDRGLTGGVIVYDCQMSSSERLVMSLARSAHGAGAELANYLEATELLASGDRVIGVKARDVLLGNELIVHAKTVVNASGPWMDRVLNCLKSRDPRPRQPLSKAFNLLIQKPLVSGCALGLYGHAPCEDRDAIVNKGARLLFINPWHNRSLIGTAHLPYHGDTENFQVSSREVQMFLDEINQAWPIADLRLDDVARVYAGLLPAAQYNGDGVQLARRHRIYDHRRENLEGLLSITGVKFTEARYVAEKTVEAVFRKLGKTPPKSITATTPIHGGQIECFDEFLARETEHRFNSLSENGVRRIIAHYGSAYGDVLKYISTSVDGAAVGDDAELLTRAEVLHALREEMAQKLADVVFRRTTMTVPGKLTEGSLQKCGRVMAEELGWNEERFLREMAEVRACPRLPLATEEAA